jgi:hypothetical protein
MSTRSRASYGSAPDPSRPVLLSLKPDQGTKSSLLVTSAGTLGPVGNRDGDTAEPTPELLSAMARLQSRLDKQRVPVALISVYFILGTLFTATSMVTFAYVLWFQQFRHLAAVPFLALLLLAGITLISYAVVGADLSSDNVSGIFDGAQILLHTYQDNPEAEPSRLPKDEALDLLARSADALRNHKAWQDAEEIDLGRARLRETDV